MNKKAIFFDNDGILVDTEELYCKATQDALAEQGFDFTRKDYAQHFMSHCTGIAGFLTQQGADTSAAPSLRKKRDDLYSRFIRTQLKSLPGAEDILKQLHQSQKYTLGIVTGSEREHFQLIHAQTQCLNYIDFVVDQADVKHTKPDPEPYLLALQKAGVKPEEALVIEDSARGLEAATKAGIECWVIPTELTQSQDFSKSKKVLNNILELPDYLL